MTCLDIVMILLIMTDPRSKQVAGLEELFKENNWIFNFAVAISVKKLVVTNLDLIEAKRGFLGFKGKFQYFIVYFSQAQMPNIGRLPNIGSSSNIWKDFEAYPSSIWKEVTLNLHSSVCRLGEIGGPKYIERYNILKHRIEKKINTINFECTMKQNCLGCPPSNYWKVGPFYERHWQ